MSNNIRSFTASMAYFLLLPTQELHREAGVGAAGCEDGGEAPEGAEAPDAWRSRPAPHPGELLPPGHQAEEQRGEGPQRLHRGGEHRGNVHTPTARRKHSSASQV